jgi:hypothetical protein
MTLAFDNSTRSSTSAEQVSRLDIYFKYRKIETCRPFS